MQAFRLGKDTAHALFLAKSPGLLLNASEECLWQELKHERFETPPCDRGCLPARAVDPTKLHNCAASAATCGGCRVVPKTDELVTEGIQGAIKIEEAA